MKFHRIATIVWRHIILLPQSFDRITDLFFWPLFDLIMWGMTSVWITQLGNSTNQREIVLAVISAAIFWRVMWSTSYEVSSAFLEECWNRNLTNLIASPVTKAEWVTAALVLGALKLVVLVIMLALSALFIYDLNIFSIGLTWLGCFIILLVFGWIVAFVALGCILRMGIRAQSLSWTLGFLVAPFSAVYFPLQQLPPWVQMIGNLLPTTHAFEGMRGIILGDAFPGKQLVVASMLSMLYLAGALWFLNRSFEKTRLKGFDHLD